MLVLHLGLVVACPEYEYLQEKKACLSCETFYMVLLFCQGFLSHKQWEAGILNSILFDLCIEPCRDLLPY